MILDKGTGQFVGERIVLSTNGVGTTSYPLRKNKTPTLILHYTERLVSDLLLIKDETVKLVDDILG